MYISVSLHVCQIIIHFYVCSTFLGSWISVVLEVTVLYRYIIYLGFYEFWPFLIILFFWIYQKIYTDLLLILIYSVFQTSSKNNNKGVELNSYADFLRFMEERAKDVESDSSDSNGFVDYTNSPKKLYAEWEKMRQEKNAADAVKTNEEAKKKKI